MKKKINKKIIKKDFGQQFEAIKHLGNPKCFPKNWGLMKEEIVDRYAVQGVPFSSLKRMCREVKISYPKLKKELRGQTCGVVGGEAIIYTCDIIRFIKGLPVID